MIRNRFLFLTALAVMAVATGAMATSLSMIAPYGADTDTTGRAIVVGGAGAIAVGKSGTGTGIIWDAVNGTRLVVSSDGAAATEVTGVQYRTTPGGPQLVAHGMTGSGHNLYSSMDDGLNWGPKNRLTNTFQPFQIGPANTLAASPDVDPDGTSKAYFGFPWGSGSSRQLEMVTASDGITAPDYKATLTAVQASTTSNEGAVRGVSYTNPTNGLALGVGMRSPNAYYVTSAGGKGALNTLNGTAGEAWAIAKDGTAIFGRSTVTDGRTGMYPWMSTGGIPGTAVELPGLPGAENNASNGLPYGASDNGDYAVGMSYPGVEKAVLWDTQAMTILDLTQFFSDAGQLDGFTRLSRAYSIYDAGGGNLWITGEGVWSPDGGTTLYTRGFVGMVPEPATMMVLALGGLALLRRRR